MVVLEGLTNLLDGKKGVYDRSIKDGGHDGR